MQAKFYPPFPQIGGTFPAISDVAFNPLIEAICGESPESSAQGEARRPLKRKLLNDFNSDSDEQVPIAKINCADVKGKMLLEENNSFEDGNQQTLAQWVDVQSIKTLMKSYQEEYGDKVFNVVPLESFN